MTQIYAGPLARRMSLSSSFVALILVSSPGCSGVACPDNARLVEMRCIRGGTSTDRLSADAGPEQNLDGASPDSAIDGWRRTMDEGACVMTLHYIDGDEDGFGSGESAGELCADASIPAGYAHSADDCDDARDDVYPGAEEVCDGIDNDCDGVRDEGLPSATVYADDDQDGWGTVAMSLTACAAPEGYAAVSGDCDDADASVRPGVTETCNGIDDECNGVADEGMLVPSGTSIEIFEAEPYNVIQLDVAAWSGGYFVTWTAGSSPPVAITLGPTGLARSSVMEVGPSDLGGGPPRVTIVTTNLGEYAYVAWPHDGEVYGRGIALGGGPTGPAHPLTDQAYGNPSAVAAIAHEAVVASYTLDGELLLRRVDPITSTPLGPVTRLALPSTSRRGEPAVAPVGSSILVSVANGATGATAHAALFARGSRGSLTWSGRWTDLGVPSTSVEVLYDGASTYLLSATDDPDLRSAVYEVSTGAQGIRATMLGEPRLLRELVAGAVSAPGVLALLHGPGLVDYVSWPVAETMPSPIEIVDGAREAAIARGQESGLIAYTRRDDIAETLHLTRLACP